MKRILVFVAAAALCSSLFAQEKAVTLKPYGFVRNYFAFDTRESIALTEDFFYYVPKDELIVDGEDLNAQTAFRFAALTTRLGVDLVGYEYDIGAFKPFIKIGTGVNFNSAKTEYFSSPAPDYLQNRRSAYRNPVCEENCRYNSEAFR